MKMNDENDLKHLRKSIELLERAFDDENIQYMVFVQHDDCVIQSNMHINPMLAVSILKDAMKEEQKNIDSLPKEKQEMMAMAAMLSALPKPGKAEEPSNDSGKDKDTLKQMLKKILGDDDETD